MNPHRLFAILLLLFATTDVHAQEPFSFSGVYVGSTPCSQGTRPLPGMSATTDCELMQWTLTLHRQASGSQVPARFTLHCAYGMSQPGTTGFVGGGEKMDMEGTWAIKQTPSTPHLPIVELHDRKTNKTITFAKLSDDLLHLLDSDQRLMIGNAAWSYTLSRISKN